MNHPYKNLPDYCFWNRALVNKNKEDVDPVVVDNIILINNTTKVATAGSCFAQHISRYLQNIGFNYYITEKMHPIIPIEISHLYNYGTYSARYGNIYTVRQLLQLYDSAFNSFRPNETYWKKSDTSYIDPFRPDIQPNGFSSINELVNNRVIHLSNVRKMFENLDVFVFTLGLTECWVSKTDGAVFPICPGVIAGHFTNDKYEFKNFNVKEIVDDLNIFMRNLKSINANSKVILTVSPVPLIATASNSHVLTATTYSKSVLRVAAEEISRTFENVDYFPSYEIITGNYAKGTYYDSDLRSITSQGVDHVMNVFLKHYVNNSEFISKKYFDQADFQKNNLYSSKVTCEEVFYDL
jgi:hypothetical protein